MTTHRDLKTIASIVPECDEEIVSLVDGIDKYSRTYEKMTGKRLVEIMPEHISNDAIIELNRIAHDIEYSIHSLHKCMNGTTDKHKYQGENIYR